MKLSRTQRFLPWIRKTSLLLFICWIGFYAYRSYIGSYHEITQDGGVASAVWFASDFKARQSEAPLTLSDQRRKHKRYAPQTRLPDSYPLDMPLQILDRLFFHKTTLTVSGQGDMRRLYRISSDGRSVTQENH